VEPRGSCHELHGLRGIGNLFLLVHHRIEDAAKGA